MPFVGPMETLRIEFPTGLHPHKASNRPATYMVVLAIKTLLPSRSTHSAQQISHECLLCEELLPTVNHAFGSSWRVAHASSSLSSRKCGGPPGACPERSRRALFEGWATVLLASTRFTLVGHSFTFSTPASAQAYHRKLLQAHNSGALTNPRVTGGGGEGGPATGALAEFALAVAASQIICLVDLASTQTEDIPF
jgi:hypothetical protein